MHSLLTSEQAANFLGLSVHWMQLKRCEGGGPRYIKLNGRTVRYRIDDLEDWVAEFGTRKLTSQAEPDPIRRKIRRLRLKEQYPA